MSITLNPSMKRPFHIAQTSLFKVVKEIADQLEFPLLISSSKSDTDFSAAEEDSLDVPAEAQVVPDENIMTITNGDAVAVSNIIERNTLNACEMWLVATWYNNRGIHYSNHYTSSSKGTTSNVATTDENALMDINEYAAVKSPYVQNSDISTDEEDIVRKIQEFPISLFLGIDKVNEDDEYYVKCVLHEDCSEPACIKYFLNGWRYKCSTCGEGIAYDLIGLIQELQKVDFLEALDFIKQVLNIDLTSWQKEMRLKIDKNCHNLHDSDVGLKCRHQNLKCSFDMQRNWYHIMVNLKAYLTKYYSMVVTGSLQKKCEN